MAHGIINRSAANPCPICGKPDWCGRYPLPDGSFMEFCNRDASKSDVIGTDGVRYKYCGETEGGASRFIDANAAADKKAQGGFGMQRKKVVNSVQVRDNAYLDKVYRYMLSLMVLDVGHRQYLQEEGWSGEMLSRHLVKSFPESDFNRFKYKNHFSENPYRKRLARMVIERFKGEYGEDCLKGVPGAYRNAKGEWTFCGRKGILFPMYDAEGNLYRLRIRLDFLDVNGKIVRHGNGMFYYEQGQKVFIHTMKGLYTMKGEVREYRKTGGKYRNFSSWKDEELDDCIVNKYAEGCQAGNNIGVYADLPDDKMYFCFLTEGEKKGIYSSVKMEVPIISFPGVNSWHKLLEGERGSRAIDYLQKRGVVMFVVAFDADKATNAAVLKNERQTIQAIKDEGFAVGVANWDILYGKGLDDLLRSGHQPEYDIC